MAANNPSSTTVLIPMKLNAFALTTSTCSASNKYSIAPITQPNYTFLRLHDNLIVPDVLDHVDLHQVAPANLNSRLTDLGSGQTHQNRLGIYIHWTLPPVYRSGSAAAPTASGSSDPNQANRKLTQGYPSTSAAVPSFGAATDYTSPDFRPVPNRWLVIRRINTATIVPAGSNIPEFQSWVIESDSLRNINDSDLQNADLEVDVSPSTNPLLFDPTNTTVVEGQAEAFVGKSTPTASWSETAAATGNHLDLTVLTSSNPLFADYQPHNSNVFSFVDNFSYTASDGSTAYLTKASCDYQVIGWHSSADHDPFTTDPSVTAPPHSTRLADCHMALKDGSTASAISWLNSSSATRILCHATMYDVSYDASTAPTIVNANTAGQLLQSKQTIGVGVTPLDALMAYCRAHQTVDIASLATLEKDLLRIQSLLISGESDDVDALQAAADESYEQAFNKIDGGTLWHFHQEADPSAVPTGVQIAAMNVLNSNQAVYDNSTREVANRRWQLFAQWWLYGFGQSVPASTYQSNVAAIGQRLSSLTGPNGRQTELQTSIQQATAAISSSAANQQPQQGTNERFYQRKDPTILFGNIQAGFENDFNDLTQVRIQSQVIVPQASALASGWTTLQTALAAITPKLPTVLQSSAQALGMEFYALRTAAGLTSAASPQVIPWFHNEAARNETRGRDMWQGTQPWMPLFIEYEALYYHIPFSKWKLKESPMLSNWGSSVLHYGFGEDISKDGITDQRAISGRVILLPQAAATLGTTIQQIFQNTNQNDLENVYGMPASEQTNLLSNLNDLEFASSSMASLTANLLTLQQGGQHVKPAVRLTNSAPVVVQAATQAASPINFTPSLMQAIDTQTSLTPYGSSAQVDTNAPPMKLVTHGQLMFTKLNVIDKFGQAISAINPAPVNYGAALPTISPCLSDTYFPGTVGDVNPSDPTARANCVIGQGDNASCPFVNLPPAINQPARLNASFVSNSSGSWVTYSEWENPIWGWIVVNFAEQGLQIFLADGTFYREVRFGGSTGTETTAKWLPYNPPSSLPSTTQIDFLIQRLSSGPYLAAFVDMILQSTSSSLVAAPNSYATFSSAIIGKPLALVNVGYSLELAGAENQNWSTVNSQGPDLHLLKPDGTSFAPNDPGGYTFPVKLGDRDRTFDGLIGYFNTAPATSGASGSSSASTTSDLDLSALFTYYPSTATPETGDPRVQISAESGNFPLMTPYYKPCGNVGDPIVDQAANMQVFGMIMDPFLPVHAYSVILPNKELRLSTYTVQEALKNINAFWKIGPMLVTSDMPAAYDATRALNSDSVDLSLKAPPSGGSATSTDPTQILPKVSLPLPAPAASSSGANAAYRYLQPYVVPITDPTTGATVGNTTEYNVFGISGDAAAGADMAQARLPDGPYTAIEGYAQIVQTASATPAA